MSTDVIKKMALFAGGVLFGTAGIKILSGKDAKKLYVHTTAAALRVKECVMNTATSIQESAEDIVAEAKEVNNSRAQEEIWEDEAGQENGAEMKEETTACES